MDDDKLFKDQALSYLNDAIKRAECAYWFMKSGQWLMARTKVQEVRGILDDFEAVAWSQAEKKKGDALADIDAGVDDVFDKRKDNQ